MTNNDTVRVIFDHSVNECIHMKYIILGWCPEDGPKEKLAEVICRDIASGMFDT